jgi:hypothetical protein
MQKPDTPLGSEKKQALSIYTIAMQVGCGRIWNGICGSRQDKWWSVHARGHDREGRAARRAIVRCGRGHPHRERASFFAAAVSLPGRRAPAVSTPSIGSSSRPVPHRCSASWWRVDDTRTAAATFFFHHTFSGKKKRDVRGQKNGREDHEMARGGRPFTGTGEGDLLR